MPIIQLPLLPDDADIELDLRQVLNIAYDRAGYDLVIDYSKPPRVKLTEPNASWAKSWLQQWQKEG